MSAPLLPGATLGVVGGGQLGRMFVHAAQTLGYTTVVLDPDAASPAGGASQHHVRSAYLDEAGLAELARLSDAVTTEFENVPADALRTLARSLPVAPAGDAVAICQDRAAEKAHFDRSGVPCAPYALIETEAQLAAVPDTLLPGILKTTRLGYDGKGQVTVHDRAALAAAWGALKQVSCVLEKRLALALELSVIVARAAADARAVPGASAADATLGSDPAWVAFPVQQNLHRDGILAVTQVPAPAVPLALARAAVERAGQIAQSMDYVGVLCVEFFVLEDGSLVANEMAPRPHNSGHYTIDACDLSQFDLQVRTMAGLPLVAPRLHSPAVMLNLLGDLWFRDGSATPTTPPWDAVLRLPGAHLHLYGKAEARPGRKMGHLTLTAASAEQARETALRAARLLGLPAF